MIWRFTMVLLSTLAALVIIVNSAEEEYEAQYRRELRPRMLDTGTPRTYEQPWRTMDLEPVVQQSTPEETWQINSSEEPPRRRRSGRKRKRRPELQSSEDLAVERYGYSEEKVRPYFDEDLSSDRKITNTPKRRRKKLEPRPERWDSLPEEDRPIRRRGQKRKRPPQIDTWPEFSEFNGAAREIEEHATTSPRDVVARDYIPLNDQDDIQTHFTDFEYKQPQETVISINGTRLGIPSQDDSSKFTDDHDQDRKYFQTDLTDEAIQNRPKIIEDKSEASNENITSGFVRQTENGKIKIRNKLKDNTQDHFKELAKAENEEPIDAISLKEILRKSNGTSLSEILQQHNLSLADLLHGKEEVLSILKSENLASTDLTENKPIAEISKEEIKTSQNTFLLNSETKYVIDSNEYPVTTETNQNIGVDVTTEAEVESTTADRSKDEEEAPRRPNIRKFSTAMRRKQRIRPMMNTTYKSQLSRDIIALNARKYFNNRRRNSSQEWKDLIPMMKKNVSNEDINTKAQIQSTTIKYSIEETTAEDVENCTKAVETENEPNNTNENSEIEIITDSQNKTNTSQDIDIVQSLFNVTERPIVQSTVAQAINASGLRRQAFNHRLKKKRLKQKNLTTEPPQDDIMMNLFGIPNLVSSSEFIARTEGPKSSLDDVTILEDFMTTEIPHNHENRMKTTKYTSPRTPTTPQFAYMPISTEENAKIEIEEIFNDTQISGRLSKILKERNMTLSELVEHRERGSSHVHLADIFHNASKEPNPPEPFLSKSLIEPISKETYPLRALLDANNHDTTAKATTIDPVTMAVPTEVNIPVIMDFGNNVNENAENMGIMSLFRNIAKNETEINKTILKKDSQGKLYETSIIIVNTTDDPKENDTIRESRVIHVINENQDDVVRWNEIFSLMHRNYENETEDLLRSTNNGLMPGLIPAEKTKKRPSEDLDGDGVIVLEDLQHLKDFESNIASESNENIHFNTYEKAESPTTKASGILDKIPSQTKSITVVTASIAGLAMVLFLLTYVGYRWQQQRTMARKKSFSDEHVPTPVFENRKGHKNNSSSRSISPMLSSNIYTLNTLDSRNGKDSPDYMWDSLRKPFQ